MELQHQQLDYYPTIDFLTDLTLHACLLINLPTYLYLIYPTLVEGQRTYFARTNNKTTLGEEAGSGPR